MVANIIIQGLLSNTGENGEFKLTEINGGKNNRAYRLDTPNKRYFIKEYFKDADDSRNRLRGEYEFCRFAQSRGIKEGAKVLSCAPEAGVALFEFIEGANCNKEDLTLSRVLESARFFKRLNQHKNSAEAHALSHGSEACFTPKAHLESVSKRIRKLLHIPHETKINVEALEFVRGKLSRRLEKIEESFHSESISFSDAEEHRCLSPSDFGFHNMLIDQNDRLRFVDFEYAGWDHPTKMICDFFCQPRFPVPIKWIGAFIEESIEEATEKRMLQKNIPLLYPLYRLKWCCIILNEFLPEGNRRRSFSTNQTEVDKQKRLQLNAAKYYFNSSMLQSRKVA
jgi:thiamine kinase-like enzyme